jgi:mono/diheme cytochrome c family protein
MKRRSTKARRFIPLACALALVAASGAARAQTSAVERGKYIFDSAGCYGCHTAPGGAPMAGGPPLRTAYGTFYAPNITPDPEFGIGQWSEADFTRALREGVSPRGENYFPVFPYPAYTKMTTQDILDLRAYLKTLAPSKNPRRAHDLRFPYSLRLVMTPWKWVNFQAGEFKPAPDYDAQWNRGAYIVQALTHCGECHTPRNKLDGLDPRQWLSGARMPVGDLVASNLTPDKTGLADWSAADIADALETGTLPEGGTLGGEMGEVVRNSTSKMRPDDRAAIVAYLKALPPLPTTVKKKEK